MTAVVLVRDIEPESTWRSRADAASKDLVLLQGANALSLLLFVVGLVAFGMWTFSRRKRSRGPVNRLGRTGLWISLLGFATCGLAAPVGLVLSALGLLRSPRRAAVVGVLIGSLGTAWLIVGVVITRESARLRILADDLEETRLEELGDLPAYDARPLFLHEAPHRSLYVEVDWMEGLEPSEEALACLRSFLAAHCAKPDGVEVRKSTEIRVEDRSNVSLNRLALSHMDGPPEREDGSAVAFVYVLCHDGQVEQRPGGEAGFVQMDTYPAAIFIDGSVLNGLRNAASTGPLRALETDLLLHEAAHVLGLSPVEHGNGVHCADPSCLFFPEVAGVDTWYSPLPGVSFDWSAEYRRRDLCRRCFALLSGPRAEEIPPVRFDGPVLVREREHYRVVSLPGWLAVLGPMEAEMPWSRVFEQARAESRDGGDEIFLRLLTSESTQEELDILFDAVAEDPQPHVAQLATRLRAPILWQAGHRQRALDEIRDARDWFTEESWPNETLARFEAERGDPRAALEAIESALEIDRENEAAHRFRVELLMELERFDAALLAADQALSAAPGLAWAHGQRGLALHRLRRFDEAIAAYERALELEPDDLVFQKRRQASERALEASERRSREADGGASRSSPDGATSGSD